MAEAKKKKPRKKTYTLKWDERRNYWYTSNWGFITRRDQEWINDNKDKIQNFDEVSKSPDFEQPEPVAPKAPETPEELPGNEPGDPRFDEEGNPKKEEKNWEENIGPASQLFPDMRLNVRGPDGRVGTSGPDIRNNFSNIVMAGSDPLNFDNPYSVMDGNMSAVEIADAAPVPDIPEAPVDPGPNADKAEVDAFKRAMVGHEAALANRQAIIDQNAALVAQREKVAKTFGMAGRAGDQLANSRSKTAEGNPMDDLQQRTHNSNVRAAHAEANKSRHKKNKFDDFRKNGRLNRAVANWYNTRSGGDAGSFNELLRTNPEEALRMRDAFLGLSANDAVNRHNLQNPKYTEADVRAFMDKKTKKKEPWQNVNGRMVNADQANAAARKMGLPGRSMQTRGVAWQNEKGNMKNPFGDPIITPAIQKGLDQGRIQQTPVLEGGPIFQRGPNVNQFPNVPSLDDRRFTPAQINDPMNWAESRPEFDQRKNLEKQMDLAGQIQTEMNRGPQMDQRAQQPDLNNPFPKRKKPQFLNFQGF